MTSTMEPPVRRTTPDELEGEAGELALDDDIALPEIDGEAGTDEGGTEAELETTGDESVGLDDEAAEEAAEAEIDPIADVETQSWETSEDDPVGEDGELDEGEAESWTHGSAEDEAAPIEIESVEEPSGTGDQGEEGLDEDSLELELPARPEDPGDEAYPDELELG